MEVGTDETAAVPIAMAANTNTRQRTAEKSAPVVVATQVGTDGDREKTEDREC